jgi:hypothetical protein
MTPKHVPIVVSAIERLCRKNEWLDVDLEVATVPSAYTTLSFRTGATCTDADTSMQLIDHAFTAMKEINALSHPLALPWFLLMEQDDGITKLEMLEEGAILIAQAEYNGVADLDAVKDSIRRGLDELALEVTTKLDSNAQSKSAFEILAAVNDVLFRQHGFNGNIDDYYNPANSDIGHVLEQKKGIPITLSVIYASVVRR